MQTNALINDVRQDATTIMQAIERLRARRAVLESLGGLKTPDNPSGWLDPAQAIGGEPGSDLTVADIIAVLDTTGRAFETLLAAGHATNLNRIRYE